MSLIKCTECSHEISSEAKSCPNCGFFLKQNGAGPSSGLVKTGLILKRGLVLTLYSFLLIALLVILLVMWAINTSPSDPISADKTSSIHEMNKAVKPLSREEIKPQKETETFKKYTGKTQEDKAFAKRVYEAFKDAGVYAVEVGGTMMFISIRQDLYRGMYDDRFTGKDLVRTWVKGLQGHTKESLCTVWVYYRDSKVIEGDVSIFGDIKVNYLE